MRTLIVIGIGLVFGWLTIWLRGKFSLSASPLLIFGVAWGLFCIVDTWFGVTQAGYGLREEVMVHAAVFGVPMVTVWLAQKWIE